MADINVKLNSTSHRKLAYHYLIAKEQVIEAGYAEEIDWQDEVSIEKLNESDFLREAAWVVLSAGFRESIIRDKFYRISEAFLNWSDANSIISQRESCRHDALLMFRNKRKIDSIIEIVDRVACEGFIAIYRNIITNGIYYLQQLPYIGPVTSYHLAKNIGLSTAKPDRHLIRVANSFGYNSVERMCKDISNEVGDSIQVIDIVLWRHATIK